MAAPTPDTRTSPPPTAPMKDGYQSLITIENAPAIILWEKSSTPPGIDGGDAIECTTMHTGTWREMRSRQLLTLTPSTYRVAYHALAYTEIQAQINVEQVITQTFSTGHYLCYYGFIRSFETDEMVEGEQPMATVTIQPTNFDPTGEVEAGPVAGTSS